MDSTEEYDDEEGFHIAGILKEKAEFKAKAEGKDESDIKNEGIKAFNKSRRKHAIDFLKKMEDRIQELSNQEVAKLLLALIAMGLSIEDEEELEYWISILEMQALQRISNYLVARNGVDNNGKIKKSSANLETFLNNTKGFTVDDLDGFVTMFEALQKIIDKKEPKDKTSNEYKRFLERKKILKKVEQIIRKDSQEKRKEAQKSKSKGQKRNRKEENTLDNLKSKMLSAGVDPNSEYWNAVISDYGSAVDKDGFVKSWIKDSSQDSQVADKIQELRGIKSKEEPDKKEEQGSIRHQNVEYRKEQQHGRSTEEAPNEELRQEEIKIDTDKKQVEEQFTNEKNQETAAKMVEDLGRGIKKEEMGRFKMVVMSGKER